MDENIATRLKYLIKELGMTDAQFADSCQLSRSTLSLLLSGKNKKASNILLSQIHKAFPEVSINWLLFGEGPLMISESFRKELYNQSYYDQKDCTNENGERNAANQDIFSYDRAIFPDQSSEITEYGKEIDLKLPQDSPNIVDYKQVTTKNNNLDFFSEKKIKTSEKKIIQITVYYNDSTFEILYPSKNK